MYDIIIIGAGSGGLTAGIYASRYGMKNLIIGDIIGGTPIQTHLIENYPGFEKISGEELSTKFENQAKLFGSEIIQNTVSKITGSKNDFTIETSSGDKYSSKYIIIAIGNKYKKLGVKGEKEFLGKGVSYCATCDGMFFRNKEVAIIGGGNSALTESLYLADICSKVYLIHRRDKFRGEEARSKKVIDNPKIEIYYNSQVAEINGGFGVEEIILNDGKIIKVAGIFVAVGNEPDTQIFDNFNLLKDGQGYITVDNKQKTSIEGIYAAGDITTASNKFKQIITAISEAAVAVNSIHEELISN